jgi:hypothetical protein
VGADDYDGPNGDEIWTLFLAAVDTTRIKALTLGAWMPDEAGQGFDEYCDALIAAADRFGEP